MAEADKIIYVGNVCAEVNETTLRTIFENCGYVAQIRIAGKPGFNTVFCFVEFADPSHARLALSMDGFQIGERKVRVSMAKPSSLEKYYEKVGNKDSRPPAAVALQARAHAKLQALQQPQLRNAQQPGFQNGHHPAGLQPQFDSHAQVAFPLHGGHPPGPSSTPPYAPGAEPTFLQNGLGAYPSICSPSYPPGATSTFPQNGASSYPRNGPPAFASPAPSPIQPPHLLSHRPPSLPPPRLNPPPPLKPVANDFGRGYGSSSNSRQKRPHQDPEKVERTIFIENLPDTTDEQVIAEHFGISGDVTSVRVVTKGPGQTKAWVEFQSPQQAITAREHDQTQFGGSVIRIQPSKTAIHTNALAKDKNPIEAEFSRASSLGRLIFKMAAMALHSSC